MKKLFSLTALLLLAAGSAAYTQQGAQQPAQQPAAAQGQAAQGSGAKPESVEDRASYAIGLDIGRNMKAQEVPVNVELLVKGLRDALAGTNPTLTDEEMQAAVQSLRQSVMAKQGEKNQKTADEFLAKNKAKQGIKTTASGLQYEVVKEGTGATPKATDKVTVHYTGTLLDGTKFDSSVDRGQPATFGVNQVISGWTEALQLMKVGGKYRLYVPPALAYGPQGAVGGEIGPNSLLIFDVELLGIGDPQPAGEQQGQTQQQPPGEKQ